jgi:hypothetical protein
MNRFRYLVFFDDGYASYIGHDEVRVVCQQSAAGVWEDVDMNSRDFIFKYLEKYPDRPMVKLVAKQESILQNTISAEFFSFKFSTLHFGRIATPQKQQM